MSAEKVNVVDVTGAGDAFVAGFSYAMVNDTDMAQACKFATRLAGLTLKTKETVSTDTQPSMARAWLADVLKNG